MQAQVYEGYFNNGNFFTAGRTIRIPENKRVYVTIIDEPTAKAEETEHAKSWKKFLSDINECDEPLGEKFDMAMSERVNITSGLDL